jgi:hypothetical protein
VFSDCYWYSPHTDAGTSVADIWHLDYGLYITSLDGLSADNLQIRANVGVSIESQNGGFIGTALFDTCIIDSCRKIAVLIDPVPASTPSTYGNIHFNNCHIIKNYQVTAGEGTNLPLAYVDCSGANGGFKFTNCIIAQGQIDGLYAQDIKFLTVLGCTVADNNNSTGTGVGIRLTNGETINIVNNQIFDQRGGSAKQVYGIATGGALDRVVLSDNNMYGNTSASVNSLATLTNTVLGANVGITTASASIASAATISLPANLSRIVIITGTTQIDTINGMVGNGDTVYFYCVGGLQFSAAGNIAKAFLTVGATLVIAQWNTTAAKWYLQGT